MGTGSFPGVKRPGRGVDHPSHVKPRLKKEKGYTLFLLWAFVACCRVNFTSCPSMYAEILIILT
jgi:hypothetical protein